MLQASPSALPVWGVTSGPLSIATCMCRRSDIGEA